MKRRWVLIPVVNGNENDKQFMIKAATNTSLVVLLHVMDPNVTGADLQDTLEKKRACMDDMETFFKKVGCRVKTYEEWGEDRIDTIAKKEGVDEILRYQKK
ncbi:MAG: hypothetical protein JW834_00800 [Candidatus Diapherotrites archaeon]|nr:hypothetical protein [Candidatus Diapherotrites archaeon]